MSALSSFNHPIFGSLTIHKDNEGREYYRAIDVCSCLRLSNPTVAIQRHVKSKYIFQFNDGTNRAGLTNYLSEPGVYQLIFKSKTQFAEEFQDWVFEEVLPKLRNQGLYITHDNDESLVDYEAREKALIAENNRLKNMYDGVKKKNDFLTIKTGLSINEWHCLLAYHLLSYDNCNFRKFEKSVNRFIFLNKIEPIELKRVGRKLEDVRLFTIEDLMKAAKPYLENLSLSIGLEYYVFCSDFITDKYDSELIN